MTIINKKHFFTVISKKNIGYFLSGLLLFLIPAIVLIYFSFQKSEIEISKSADGNASAKYEYYGDKRFIGQITVTITDAPVYFLLYTDENGYDCFCDCLIKSDNHTDSNNEYSKKKDNGKFLNITSETLANVINSIGGIDTEYSGFLDLPAGMRKYEIQKEAVHIYGSTFQKMLTESEKPNSETLKALSYGFADFIKKYILLFSDKDFLFLSENCETDISYVDYYDNIASFKKSVNEITVKK